MVFDGGTSLANRMGMTLSNLIGNASGPLTASSKILLTPGQSHQRPMVAARAAQTCSYG